MSQYAQSGPEFFMGDTEGGAPARWPISLGRRLPPARKRKPLGCWALGLEPLEPRVLMSTTRVSVGNAGEQGNFSSFGSSISGDGLLVAFESIANNLVAGDTNFTGDIFVRNLASNENETERVSVNNDGEQGDNGSASPSISANGLYVAFQSNASNFVPGDTENSDIFVRNLAGNTTTRVSVSSTGGQPNNGSYAPSISADGRFVAFESDASNLVDDDTNNLSDVFVRDTERNETKRVSVTNAGAQANGASFAPSISADGRYVAFQSSASNLVAGDTNNARDIFVRDLIDNTTIRVSLGAAGAQANGFSFRPSISGDGLFVAFQSLATNLVPSDTNSREDIFVRNILGGTTTRVSVSSTGRRRTTPAIQPPSALTAATWPSTPMPATSSPATPTRTWTSSSTTERPTKLRA
jgi:Tol biopolymer transport system component